MNSDYENYNDDNHYIMCIKYCNEPHYAFPTFKDPDAGKDWRQQEKGVAEEEIIR